MARLNRVRIIKYDVNNVCVFVIWGFNVLFTCNRSKLRVLLYCLTLTCTSVGEKEQITMWVLTIQILHTRKGTDLISIIKKKSYPFQHVYTLLVLWYLFIKKKFRTIASTHYRRGNCRYFLMIPCIVLDWTSLRTMNMEYIHICVVIVCEIIIY